MSNAQTGQEITQEEEHFQRQFPLTFNLWDLEEQPLLSCMGPAGQTLLLRLRNGGKTAIELDDSASKASDAHFTLRFRRGTLYMPDAIQFEGPGGQWQFHHTRGPQIDELHMRAPDGFRLAAGESCDLFLHRVQSHRLGGTRNSRVMLAYNHLSHDSRSLSGYRQTVISIVEQYPPESRGEAGAKRRPLPLRVGFSGSNTVLTSASPDADERASQLLLQVSNLANLPLSFRRVSTNDDRSSRLILAFEVQDEGEQRKWALGSTSQVSAIEPFLDDWEAIRYPDAEKVVWVFTPQLPEITLDPEQDLRLVIGNIRTDLPAGPTNLYVTLENVPDPQGNYYTDQTHILTVQKSPLVYNDQSVSIGTVQSSSRLNVAGDMAIGHDFVRKPAGENNLIIQGSLGLGTPTPNGRLELNGDDGSQLRFGVLDEKAEKQINRVNVITTDAPLEFESSKGSFHATLNSQGLSVQGQIYDRGGLVMPIGAILPFAGNVAPAGWLFCNGQTVDKSKYADLFDVIQYTYGGSNDSFALPNLCQRAPMGLAPGSEYFNSLGQAGGSPTVTLKVDHMPAHSHGVNDPGHWHPIKPTDSEGQGRVDDAGEGGGARNQAGTAGAATGISIKDAGGGLPHENLSPYLTVNFIIKY
jgi:microcystin-dependent protein